MRIKCGLKNKSSGFTLLELMVTMAIIAIIVTDATPISFFQQTQSIDYANIAIEQAKSFTNMINDSYSLYYNQAKNGVVSIPYSTVVANGYSAALSQTDRYGGTPCATLSYNSKTQKLNMFMYYVGGSGVQADIVAGASKYLNGMAGQLVNNVYQGAFNSWNVPLANIVGSCGAPVANSLAVNLNLLTTRIGNINNDTSLHRESDTSGTPPGTATNTNTMQTDIIMGYSSSSGSNTTYNGIYFTENQNGPYLTSGANSRLVTPYNSGNATDMVVANANVIANSFVLLDAEAPVIPCSQSELGKIVLDSTSIANVLNLATLTCTYDTLNCASAQSNYCYLPHARLADAMIPTTNSSSYTCPSGYVDASVPITLTGGASPLPSCNMAEVGPRVITPTGTTTNGSSIIYTGITATTTWSVLTSSGSCVAGTLVNGTANILNVSCINYPDLIENIESNLPFSNYIVILASDQTKCTGNGCASLSLDSGYVNITLFPNDLMPNAPKKLTLDNDGYLSCYNGNNKLLWQSPGGYTSPQQSYYNFSFYRLQNPVSGSPCVQVTMQFTSQADEEAFYQQNFWSVASSSGSDVIYFAFWDDPGSGVIDPACPANINKSTSVIPGPLQGVTSMSVLAMRADGDLIRTHLWGHQGGSEFPGDQCGSVGFGVGCINSYPLWDSGTAGNTGAFLIYNPADNSIDVISADSKTIIKKLC